LAFHFEGFRIAPQDTQCIGEQPSRLRLSRAITAGESQRLAAAPFCLVSIVFRQPQPSEFDPQQWIVGLDTQSPIQSG